MLEHQLWRGGGRGYDVQGCRARAPHRQVRTRDWLLQFSGLFPWEDNYFVAGTDGVGTKLKLAFETGNHDTIGIDLVAMSVKDIVTSGAKPLFFLDYYGTSKLDVDAVEKVMKGIKDGCKEALCPLLGGETAEMPGFYAEGEYDLSGSAMGIVKKDKLIDGKTIVEGDVLIGLASSGVHSNGFSLARSDVSAGSSVCRVRPATDVRGVASLLPPLVVGGVRDEMDGTSDCVVPPAYADV
ncbi:hypothetical protein BS78_09G028400 [Paspalum vaginatum]|nr:hypothetical protein BS78_09G028400 [Paspalum vaginatum]